MTSYYAPTAPGASRPTSYYPPPAAAQAPMANAPPPGTFTPGTKVQVGGHRVLIERYLSEGGFAHVYVVQVPNTKGGHDIAVLKRVAVPDKDSLASMRTEVETMKKLKGHRHIVTYIDSHASQLKGGGYEVFLLMEFCGGGGLIDFMNTRLKDRLKEPEVLKIFSDTAEGLACMHYLKPPLLHRDLKVENILISTKDGQKLFKLCDFGSTAPPRPAATNAAEGRLIEEDVQKHTTMQYRSPEMVDVYRKQPIDEKSDIWALGVLLYKLCYYTTPFEAQGQMAILTASFKFPSFPQFSDKLKMLIAVMLSENPAKRPNIYQVLKEVCEMRGKEVPIKDIYSRRTQSEARSNQRLPSPDHDIKSPPPPGAALQQTPARKEQAMPDITPMRRGRPAATQKTPLAAPSAASAPVKDKDPFAALDSADVRVRAAAVDKLAARFPDVDEFGILGSKQGNFDFNSKAGRPAVTKPETKALADQTFEKLAHTEPIRSKPVPSTRPKPITKDIDSEAVAELPTRLDSRESTKPASASAARPIAVPAARKPPSVSNRPIWRVPTPPMDESVLPGSLPRDTENRLQTHVSRTAAKHNLRSGVVSERPSMQNMRTDSFERGMDIERARSADVPHTVAQKESTDDGLDEEQPDNNDISTIQYLRETEKEKHHIPLPHRHGEHHHHLSLNRLKHASMPASALSRPLVASKLGAAFRRFEAGEQSASASESEDAIPALSPMPYDDPIPALSPMPTLSKAKTLGGEFAVEEVEEDLSPELRRELERRQAEAEEKRVSAAAAAYRHGRTRSQGSALQTAGTTRKVSAIQSRVDGFLAESGRSSSTKRTAEGYGRYTEVEEPRQDRQSSSTSQKTSSEMGNDSDFSSTRISRTPATASAASAASLRVSRNSARPSAPPKKAHLRTGTGSSTLSNEKPAAQPAALVEEDLMEFTVIGDAGETGDVDDSVTADFAKRYPSLTLDLVESEIASRRPTKPVGLRMRDV